MKRDNNLETVSDLRQKAEAMIEKETLKRSGQLTEIDALKLVHELQVYQIELELQNEELFLAKERAAELATEKYAELFDFAPSGYFILSKEGRIIDLNLCGSQILGKERSLLKNYPLGFFVSNDTKSTFNQFLNNIFASKAKEICEVTLIINVNVQMYVHLNGIVTESGEQCLVTMVDITAQKKAEQIINEREEKYRFMFANNPQPKYQANIKTLVRTSLQINETAYCRFLCNVDE